ncbi:Alpha/Beta hydrolase protein [Mycena epipterygia]|nr:Alpha/Beta hydrolase protein [Mycena epipterygia]
MSAPAPGPPTDVARLDKTTRRMLSGKTPAFALTVDPRFSFSLYVPTAHSFAPTSPRLPLLVVVHGTRRQTGGYLTHLKAFCERHKIVLLLPLFPAGLPGPDPLDVHAYKTLLVPAPDPSSSPLRFDLLLLAMLSQAALTWHIDPTRFFLHGFSGGAQFAHRFLYLHPARLLGVSVAAPGGITHPGAEDAWPAGLGGVRALFGEGGVELHGEEADWARVTQVPVQILVGGEDTDASMLPRDARAGRNRLERARFLHAALVRRGVARCALREVDGVAHDGMKCLPAFEEWLAPLVARV